MNRYQIRRRVQGLLRDDSYPVEVINEALNRVLVDLNGMGRFRFQQGMDTVTLVSGTYKYSITSTIIAEKLVVYRLGDTSGNQAILSKFNDPITAVQDAGAFITTGIPSSYLRWQNQWWFDPIPDATADTKVISVFHFADIAELTNDLATPTVPSRWHSNLLVYGVAADIAPGLMVRTPTGALMVGQAYQNARKEFMVQESWEPFTDKRLFRDERWKGFENFGNVGGIR